MSTVANDIRATLENQFASWTHTQVQFMNRPKQPVVGTSFIRLTVQFATADRVTITGRRSTPSGQEHVGMLIVQVFCPSDVGSGETFRVADLVRTLLDEKRLDVLAAASGIATGQTLEMGVAGPPVQVPSDDTNWHQVNVSVPFSYLEF